MLQNERDYHVALAQLKALEISLAQLAEELGQNGHSQGSERDDYSYCGD